MTHLHLHTNYSFMAGTMSVKQCVARGAEMKLPALAIADTNNMTGAIEFYLEARRAGVKPILGVELRTRTEQAVLLAKDAAGYAALCGLVTRLCEEYPAARPVVREEEEESGVGFRVSEENRKQKTENRNAVGGEGGNDSGYRVQGSGMESLTSTLTSTADGFLASLLCSTDTSRLVTLSATPSLLAALARAGKKDLYIELVRAWERGWGELRAVVREYRLPVVATNDVYFASEKERGLHALLRAIGTNTTVGTLPPREVAHPSQYFCPPAELERRFARSPEALKNIAAIAEMCNVELDLASIKFASFRTADGADKYYLLRRLTEEGFARRYPKATSHHRQRLEKEYGIIAKLDFVDYFLVAHDMVQYAQRNNYPYVGRGSGANSIIAYCLGITNVDPIELNLFFERFLNPERKSPPDFDVDFSWKNRDDVIDYLFRTYGRENSAMICTVSTFNSRGAIRETGKALGYSESEIKTLTAQLPHWGRTPLTEISERLPECRHLDIRAPYMQKWLRIADRLLSFPNHYGIHCGGVILAPRPLTEYTPTQVAPKGVRITQQDMFAMDDWGLVKLDVLSTRGLGVFDDTMREVTERYGARPPVDDYKVACADHRTREIMRSAETIGCFYIESPAMRQLLQKLRTDTFEMLTAASSIIRPGVSQSGMMQAFIERYHDPSKIVPPHPKIGDLLKDTFGVMVYQEDVIKVAHFFAHLSLGEADLLRRGMSGKMRSKDAMQQLRDKFFDRCAAQGVEEPVTAEIWRQIESFAGYSFCKAHSASYAVLSFQEAWLKAYYPALFLCNVLNNQGGYYRAEVYIQEAKRLGIEVLLPDVNESEEMDTVPYVREVRGSGYEVSGVGCQVSGENRKQKTENIRLGFFHIKDLSARGTARILAERKDGGRYRTFEDFLGRAGVSYADAYVLVRCGTCDAFGMTRAQMLFTAKLMLHGGEAERKNGRRLLPAGEAAPSAAPQTREEGVQSSLPLDPPSFGEEVKSLPAYEPEEVCGIELETFSFAVSTRVLDHFRDKLAGTVKAKDLRKYVNRRVVVGGWMIAAKPTRTRKGERMKFINIDDDTGMIDVVIFPKCYEECAHLLRTAGPYKIRGRVKEEFGVLNLVAEKVENLGGG